jgi:bacterioferritin
VSKKQELIDGLTEDLNLELEAVLRHIYHASSATGLLGHELRELMKGGLQSELSHAVFLADKITALGAELQIDVQMPKKVKTAKEMMEIEIAAEKRLIENYTRRVGQAEEFGDRGLAIRLEDILAQETDDAEDLQRLGR